MPELAVLIIFVFPFSCVQQKSSQILSLSAFATSGSFVSGTFEKFR